jgi:hypothetical protein
MITAVPTSQVQDISPVDAIWTIIQSQTKAVRQAIYLRVEAEQRQARTREAISAMRRQSEENGNAALTLEDINDEIRQAREARRK